MPSRGDYPPVPDGLCTSVDGGGYESLLATPFLAIDKAPSGLLVAGPSTCSQFLKAGESGRHEFVGVGLDLLAELAPSPPARKSIEVQVSRQQELEETDSPDATCVTDAQ